MFVKIIDSGECFSTTMEFIDGVYANRTEWEKYNFYPQNGMVGEVVKITPRAYVVKIKDGIYVPITKRGIKEITREDYLDNKCKNVCRGMDERQQRINSGIDSLIGDSWKHLPDMKSHFKHDIIENIKKLTCDFSRNIYLPDLERSCVIYATDMILEYNKQWGSILPPYVIQEVSAQVIDIYCEFWPDQFLMESISRCKTQINDLVHQPNAKDVIRNYYRKVNQRYSIY